MKRGRGKLQVASASDSHNQLPFASYIHTKPNFINMQTQAKDKEIDVRQFFFFK